MDNVWKSWGTTLTGVASMVAMAAVNTGFIVPGHFGAWVAAIAAGVLGAGATGWGSKA